MPIVRPVVPSETDELVSIAVATGLITFARNVAVAPR